MRGKQYLINLLLALGSLVLTALVLETGFRVRAHLENQGLLDRNLDPGIKPPDDGPARLGHMIRLARNPRIIYELKPGLAVSYQGAHVTTNAWGFRGIDPRLDPDETGLRIVGLGDSFMFGQGVADDETYLAVLEERLNALFPARTIEVVNTAVPGYNTVMEIETLMEKGLRFRPNLVVLEIVGNDLELPNFIRRKVSVLALDRLFLGDFIDRRLGRYGPLIRELDDFGLMSTKERAVETVPPEYAGMVGWEAFAAAMRELKRLARIHHFRVVSILLAPGKDGFHQRALQFSEQLGFRVLWVGEGYLLYIEDHQLESYAESPLALGPNDGHPSPLGHRIAAETLLDFLIREDLLRRSRSHDPGQEPSEGEQQPHAEGGPPALELERVEQSVGHLEQNRVHQQRHQQPEDPERQAGQRQRDDLHQEAESPAEQQVQDAEDQRHRDRRSKTLDLDPGDELRADGGDGGEHDQLDQQFHHELTPQYLTRATRVFHRQSPAKRSGNSAAIQKARSPAGSVCAPT
ncbi:MAG: hypothetical protein GY856_13310 [bacterium]|nr:hypothetical protein [bacterium]